MPDRDGRAQRREDEAADTLHAIKRGEIDAVVVAENEDDPQVLLLGTAGRRYRALVERVPTAR